MADIQSSQVNMADDDLLVRYSQGGDGSTRRGWRCPADGVIAAYLDSAGNAADRTWVESHLADCEHCRSLVADIVTMQRLDPPAMPHGLTQRAIALVAPRARRVRWILLPAATMAGVAFVVTATLMLRSPQQLIMPTPSAPAAPVIAKSEPAPNLSPPVADMVRKLTPADALPSVVFPKPDNVVTRDRLEFTWKAVPRSRYYEIHVVTPEGEPVWEAQSEAAFLKVPSDVTLNNGSYFVWISAYLDDGRVQKSAVIRFQVAASR
jgi:hypothetical protein